MFQKGKKQVLLIGTLAMSMYLKAILTDVKFGRSMPLFEVSVINFSLYLLILKIEFMK